MGFASPIWLWGLLGLTIPVAIHLLSRKENKVIKFGSIRHLQASVTKQSINFRINEWLLLAIRCILIIFLVMVLSGLHFSEAAKKENWLLIENGLARDSQFKPIIDSLTEAGYKPKRLAENFPALDALPTDSSINYWRLIESITMFNVDKVTVLSYNLASGFYGKRIALPQHITWLTKEPQLEKFNLYNAVRPPDSVAIRSGMSDRQATSFNTTVLTKWIAEDRATARFADTISVTIVRDDAYNHDAEIIGAALNAFNDNPFLDVQHSITGVRESPLSDSTDWIIWLSDTPPPPAISKNVISMVVSTEKASPLFVQGLNCEAGNECWQITKRLNSETALAHQLPVTLYEIITRKSMQRFDATIRSHDKRSLDERMSWSDENMQPLTKVATNRGADSWLILVVLSFLLVERLVAKKRNQ
jgi:hypothetical protein